MSKTTPKTSKFELYVKTLPIEVQSEVVKTDEFLRTLDKEFKFKRAFAEHGGQGSIVTYTSPWGFRYKIRRFKVGELHDIQWSPPHHQNYIIETLEKLAEKSPEFADKIFANNIRTHIAKRVCGYCTFTDCHNIKSYEYNGQTKRTCGSAIQFEWTPSDFEDVRKVVVAINEVVKANNDAAI